MSKVAQFVSEAFRSKMQMSSCAAEREWPVQISSDNHVTLHLVSVKGSQICPPLGTHMKCFISCEQGSVPWLKCEDSRVSSNPWNYGHVLLVVITLPYLLRIGGYRPSNPKLESSRFPLNNNRVSHHLFYVWTSPLASQNSQLKLNTRACTWLPMQQTHLKGSKSLSFEKKHQHLSLRCLRQIIRSANKNGTNTYKNLPKPWFCSIPFWEM